MPREYTDPLTDRDKENLMTVKEIKKYIKEGWIMDYDGIGYWVKDGMESKDQVFETEPEDATHATWFNR